MRFTRIPFSVINVAVKRPLTNYEILQEFWKSRFGDLFLFTISDVQINIEDFARHNNAEGIQSSSFLSFILVLCAVRNKLKTNITHAVNFT